MSENFATLRTLIVSLSLALLTAGCASTGSPDNDPFENYNRKVTRLNIATDERILVPIAKGYRKVVPEPVRNGISNFFSNLREPYSALNSALQGDFKQAGIGIGRFVINTTIGVLGLGDPATEMGIDGRREDFGQTLAVWGVQSGPHLVFPFFGPSNFRDGISLVPDFSYGRVAEFEDSHANLGVTALRVVDLRTQFLGTEELLALQPDPYLFMREGYRQRRQMAITNGVDADAEQTEDDLLDELLEDN